MQFLSIKMGLRERQHEPADTRGKKTKTYAAIAFSCIFVVVVVCISFS